MRAEHLFEIALSLYPADFRARFSREMRDAFAAATLRASRSKQPAFAIFVATEIVGVFLAAVAEWRRKLASDPLVRARALPDCRRMRPVGLTRAEWAAGLDDGR